MANALAVHAKAPQKEAIQVFRPRCRLLFLLPFKSFFTVNHIPKEDILVRPLFAACLKKGRKVETILKGIYYELMTLIYERAPSKYSWHLRLSQYEVVVAK